MSLTFQKVFHSRCHALKYGDDDQFVAIARLTTYIFGVDATVKDAARIIKAKQTPMIAARALFTHMLRLPDDGDDPIEYICKSGKKPVTTMEFQDDEAIDWAGLEVDEGFKPTNLKEAYVARVTMACQDSNPVAGCYEFFKWAFEPVRTYSSNYDENGIPKPSWVGTVYKECGSHVPRFCRIMAETAMRDINGDPLSYIKKSASEFNRAMAQVDDVAMMVEGRVPHDPYQAAVDAGYTHITWNQQLTLGWDSQWFTVWRPDGRRNYARLCYNEEDAPFLSPYHSDWLDGDPQPPEGSEVVDETAKDKETAQAARDLWLQVMDLLSGEVPPSTYDIHLSTVVPYSLRDNRLTIHADCQPTHDAVKRCATIIDRKLSKIAEGVRVNVEVASV